MTGEHFSSATGKELEKKKDAYVRFRWLEKPKGKPVATIVEKARLEKDPALYSALEDYYKRGETGLCLFCGNAVSTPKVEFEFYNWEKEGVEVVCVADAKCLESQLIKQKLDTLKALGKNPTFLVELNCLSVEKCGFFSKASDFRNCQHIVLRFEELVSENPDESVNITMTPLLFCKRAHPGQFSLDCEQDTFWNVKNAGLVLMTKEVYETLEKPEVRAQLEKLKMQNPQLIEAYRKMVREDPMILGQSMAVASVFERFILEPTASEMWDEVLQGNDYY